MILPVSAHPDCPDKIQRAINCFYVIFSISGTGFLQARYHFCHQASSFKALIEGNRKTLTPASSLASYFLTTGVSMEGQPHHFLCAGCHPLSSDSALCRRKMVALVLLHCYCAVT